MTEGTPGGGSEERLRHTGAPHADRGAGGTGGGPGSAVRWALRARQPANPEHRVPSSGMHFVRPPLIHFSLDLYKKHRFSFFTISSSFPNTGIATGEMAKQKKGPGSSYCTVESKVLETF